MENKLILEFQDSTTIEIDVRYPIQIINGSSGLGKSYICYLIEFAKESPTILKSTNIPLDSILVWDSISSMNNTVTNKLIIIDRYSFFRGVVDWLADFINSSKTNRFILITHSSTPEIEIGAQADLLLQYNEETKAFKTVVYFDTPEYWKGTGFFPDGRKVFG